MNTISYKEVVRLIHPDHNSNVIDVGSKMASAKLYRDDEASLFKLAVKWGIVQSTITDTEVEGLPLSAKDNIIKRFNEKKLRAYKEFLAEQKEPSQGGIPKTPPRRSRQRCTTSRTRSYFMVGDIVYIKTKATNVRIVRVTPKRVYYQWNGRVTYAAKKNVRSI